MNKRLAVVRAVTPFTASLSNSVNERLAQAQAILSLSGLSDSSEMPNHIRRTAHSAALSIVSDVVAELTFGIGATFVNRHIIASVNAPLAKAQAVISLVVHCGSDLASDDTRELASTAAIGFLQEAMETLEREVL
jgi:hypothetical protein